MTVCLLFLLLGGRTGRNRIVRFIHHFFCVVLIEVIVIVVAMFSGNMAEHYIF